MSKNGKAEPAPENLEQVREILFGSQVRTFDRQIDQLDERINSRLSAMEQDSRKRHQSLERFVKEELRRLDQKLTSEVKALNKGAGRLEQTMDKAVKKVGDRLDKSLESVRGEVEVNDRRVREHILDEVNSMHDALSKQHQELSNAINAAVMDLAGDKVSHTNLALLFNELAVRLSDDTSTAGSAASKKKSAARSKA